MRGEMRTEDFGTASREILGEAGNAHGYRCPSLRNFGDHGVKFLAGKNISFQKKVQETKPAEKKMYRKLIFTEF